MRSRSVVNAFLLTAQVRFLQLAETAQPQLQDRFCLLIAQLKTLTSTGLGRSASRRMAMISSRWL
jgi:hypothetical protein